MGYISLAFMLIAISVVCAYVLFNAADKHHRNKWVWGAIGLVTNIFGLAIFRIFVGNLV